MFSRNWGQGKSMENITFKIARKKYGRISSLQPRIAKKNAEERLSCNLSIFHDVHRNEEWVKRIKSLVVIEEFI